MIDICRPLLGFNTWPFLVGLQIQMFMIHMSFTPRLIHHATSFTSPPQHIFLSLLLLLNSQQTSTVSFGLLAKLLEALYLGNLLGGGFERHGAGLGHEELQDLGGVLVVHVDLDGALMGGGRLGLGQACVGGGWLRDGVGGSVAVGEVDGHFRRLVVLAVAVDNHGDGGVVVFEPGEAFFPEFPAWLACWLLDLIQRARGTHLGPMWPFFMDEAKSMCMRVTSDGRTAAPGPHRRLSSCETIVSNESRCVGSLAGD